MINQTLIRRGRLASLAVGLGMLALFALPGAARPALPGANGKIAFMELNGDPFNPSSQLYVVNPDGSGQTELTTEGSNAHPSWSPDGNKLAFDSDRNVSEDIYLMNADGSGQTRLTNAGTTNIRPAWSPDGRKIAFASDRDGNLEIYAMNADGSGQIRLTANSASDSMASWSPDGSKIAFASDRDGNYEIYVMNADGSGQTRLTTNAVQDLDPRWSPDGSKIAFWNNDGLVLMNSDGSNQVQLTSGGLDSTPTWSPDGTKIGFTSYRDGLPEVYAMNADGSGTVDRLTTNAVFDVYPDWQTIPSADLALGIAASPSSVKGSQRVTYSVSVLNAGPSAASGIVVTDTLPSQTTFLNATPSRGSCLTPSVGSTGTITCNLGSLAASQTAVTQVVVTVLARKASITNTASVASSTSDPNPANNTASITSAIK
jgi:uncharacterized repeat protein (TIGR01451 family)